MCRHCERLVEDVQHKQVVHDFMEVLTAGINRTFAERKMSLRVTPDEVEFYVTVPDKNADPLGMGIPTSVLKLLYRDLLDAVK